MFNRYEEQIETTGEGDVPPHPKNHNEAYQQFPLLIDKMNNEDIFDKVIVRDRSGNEYYNSGAQNDADFLTSMQVGRNTFYNNPNWKKEMISKWNNVISKMHKREASKEELVMAEEMKKITIIDNGLLDISKVNDGR